MAEYIEREWLFKFADSIEANHSACKRVLDMGGVRHLARVIPAADVAPVVRCFECKYQEDCFSQIGHWSRDSVLELNNYEYHKLDFCSYGERRGGDDGKEDTDG